MKIQKYYPVYYTIVTSSQLVPTYSKLYKWVGT